MDGKQIDDSSRKSNLPDQGKDILHIVVADDDHDDYLLIKEAVRMCNQTHVVSAVYNGEQLLDLLQSHRRHKRNQRRLPDLIILDLLMPIKDGLETLRIIKADPMFRDVPVYILSASQDDSLMKKAIELGAEHFFRKPQMFEDLLDTVSEICERKFSKGNVTVQRTQEST